MCLLLFSYDPEAEQQLVVLANRDEFYSRDALQANFWSDHPEIIAGRDVVAGGTWLGVNTNGRFAAVTNFREPGKINPDALSRGDLTTSFLTGHQSTTEYLNSVSIKADSYNGFNLIVFETGRLGYFSNRTLGGPRILSRGLYGVSNHLLDTACPKVEMGKRKCQLKLEECPVPDSSFLDIMENVSQALDHELPDTGVGLERERVFSSMCVVSPDYGTRCITSVNINRNGSIRLMERTLHPHDLSPDTVVFDIRAS